MKRAVVTRSLTLALAAGMLAAPSPARAAPANTNTNTNTNGIAGSHAFLPGSPRLYGGGRTHGDQGCGERKRRAHHRKEIGPRGEQGLRTDIGHGGQDLGGRQRAQVSRVLFSKTELTARRHDVARDAVAHAQQQGEVEEFKLGKLDGTHENPSVVSPLATQ